MPSHPSHTLSQRLLALSMLLRPHQWSKNLLIYVPLFTAHLWHETAALWAETLAFIAFCLASSAIYVMNDALDVDSDRAHPIKRHRPFASGALPASMAWWLVPALIAMSGVLAWQLPFQGQLAIASYWLLGLAYCFLLKTLLWLDILALAALYTLRILAGAGAIAVIVSPWLAGFSMFMFFGLAALKRYAELRASGAASLSGRGYLAEDAVPVISLGSSASLVAVLVLALYLNSDEVHQMYSQAQWLWLIGPTLLYWQARLWTLAHRGHMLRDPLSFSMRDPASWGSALFCALFFALAL